MLLQEEDDIFFCNTSCPQHGQTHVKYLAVFGARFGQMWVIILLPLGLGFMGFFKKFEISPFLLALLIKKISNSKWSNFLKLDFCKNKRKRKNKIKVTKCFEFYYLLPCIFGRWLLMKTKYIARSICDLLVEHFCENS